MGVSILYRCPALLIYNRRPERRDTMRQLLALSMLLVLAPAPAERSFKVEVSKVAWQPVEISGMPKGLQQRVLHDDKEKHVVSAIVRYPKGFHEPRHYHTTCGHSIYILKGKLKSPEGVAGPGGVISFPADQRHAPLPRLPRQQNLFFTY